MTYGMTGVTYISLLIPVFFGDLSGNFSDHLALVSYRREEWPSINRGGYP